MIRCGFAKAVTFLEFSVIVLIPFLRTESLIEDKILWGYQGGMDWSRNLSS
jgi:hypothetical protein